MSNGVSKTESRQSNMELVRILAIMCVIVLHYNLPDMGGGFAYVSNHINSAFLQAVEALSGWPVDAFLMLSGYFMCAKRRISVRKPIELLVELIVFQLVIAIISATRAGTVLNTQQLLSCLVPANYYVSLYIAVYLVSPYINCFFEKLGVTRQRKFLLLVFAVFAVWPYAIDCLNIATGRAFHQASTISSTGNQNGYNITNFLLCYFVGAGIRTGAVSIRKPLLAFVVATICIMLLGAWQNIYLAIEYLSPFVICQAAAIICFFSSGKVRIRNSKLINRLAAGVYTVYLIHHVFYPYFHVEWVVNKPLYVLAAHLVICQITLFALSFAVYLMYDALAKPLFRMLWARVKVPEINLETADA